MMHNDYSLLKLAEIRHAEDMAAAERWRAGQPAPAGREALRMRRPWMPGLRRWLARLAYALEVRLEGMTASRADAGCVH